METGFSSSRGVVSALYVPVRLIDFVPQDGGGKSIVKVNGLAFDDDLFLSSSRSAWDPGDPRARLPWSSMGLLIEPEAHDVFRSAWREAVAGVISVGEFPVWVVGYRLVGSTNDSYRARGVSLAIDDELRLSFAGARLAESVFADARGTE